MMSNERQVTDRSDYYRTMIESVAVVESATRTLTRELEHLHTRSELKYGQSHNRLIVWLANCNERLIPWPVFCACFDELVYE
jgi:hypothetical protein